MTARQVMDEIQAMTAEERGQVADFLRQLEKSQSTNLTDDQLVDELSDRILDRHADLMRKLAS